MDFAEFYQAGGAFMHPITTLGLVSALVGLLALVLRTRAIGIVALLFGGLCLGLGLFGYGFTLVDLDSVLQTVAPDQAAEARARGEEIARIPLLYGAAWSAPGVLGGALALVLARRERRSA